TNARGEGPGCRRLPTRKASCGRPPQLASSYRFPLQLMRLWPWRALLLSRFEHQPNLKRYGVLKPFASSSCLLPSSLSPGTAIGPSLLAPLGVDHECRISAPVQERRPDPDTTVQAHGYVGAPHEEHTTSPRHRPASQANETRSQDDEAQQSAEDVP